MKLTRAGRGLALMTLLTLVAAASSGNNLLYLLYSAGLAALLISCIVGRLNVNAIEADAEGPDQIFRGSEFPLTLRLRRRIFLPSSLLHARWGTSVQPLEKLGSETAKLALRIRATARGLNRIEGICLESSFPFGLFIHRKRLPPVTVTVYPALREIRSPREIASLTETGGELALKKGAGDEFYGVREYTASDDIRWINWKLTAKQGRPLITEFAEPVGSKITVRLDSSGMGADGERRIEEAASACRYFIDSGAEVRLITPESEEGYGRGLLHLDRLLRALALLGEGRAPRACKPGEGQNGFSGDPALLRRLTWFGAVLVFASMFLIDEIQPWLLAAMGIILAISFRLQEKDGPWVPKPLWDALSFAVLIFVTTMDWRFSGIIVTNTHLVLYLMANRLLSPLREESLSQTLVILFLAFFLISGQTISLWYFLAFLLFTLFAAAWLAAASGAKPALWRRWAPPVAAAWLATLGLTSLCFAVTPRFDNWYQKNPLAAVMGLDKLRAQSESVMGFTENVSLGFFGQLKTSVARVMRIRPELKGSEPPTQLYIRGAAFDHFDGRRWGKTPMKFIYLRQQSSRGRIWLRRQGNHVLLPAAADPRAAAHFVFTVFPMNTAVVFTTGRPFSIDTAEGTVSFDATDSLYFSAPISAGIQYRIEASDDPLDFGKGIENYAVILRDFFLQVPDGVSPKTKQLAQKVTAGLRDDNAKARAVQAYLRSGYHYSTFSKGTATLDNFLFSVKSGNCEYFATAGAILLRLAGIPTRLVAGFLAQDWNEFGRFFDVRQNEAHAWVEAYINGRWTVIDPTPPEAFSLSDTLSERFSRVFNAIQARWYERVIGYDSFVQRNSFYRLGLGSAKQALEKAVRWALYLALALSFLVTAAGTLRWAVQRLRSSRTPYFLAQAALERAGLRRQPHLTPKEYAGEVLKARPMLSAFRELVDWHYYERYGSRRLSPDERTTVEKLLRKILEQL